MNTVDQVLARIDSVIPRPLDPERIPLDQSLHRILRESIQATEDQPPFPRSSIDGYLTHPDQNPGKARLLPSRLPGEPISVLPSLGTALRIYTGSSLPSGAALIMQEDTRILPDQEIELLKKPSTSLVRHQGSHARKGDTLLDCPSLIQPGSLALLASFGITQPKVSRLPRVAHLVTGAELVDPSALPQTGKIRDTNSIMIRSLLLSYPANPVWHGRIGDDRRSFSQSLAKALLHKTDLVLLSGGSSVGDHDHTGSVLEELGFQILVRQVAVRPGKPLILAQKGDTLAFGLPGNPLSHFVCFHLFVRRALDRWVNQPKRPLLRAELLSGAELKTDPRETWWPCHLGNRNSTFTASPLPWRDSSDLSCLAQANGLLRIPAGQEAGSPVEVLPTISW
jgi:molybdopterin molybdotransferase